MLMIMKYPLSFSVYEVSPVLNGNECERESDVNGAFEGEIEDGGAGEVEEKDECKFEGGEQQIKN